MPDDGEMLLYGAVPDPDPAGDQLAYVHTDNPRTTSLWVSGIEGEGARQVAPVAGTQFWLTWNW